MTTSFFDNLNRPDGYSLGYPWVQMFDPDPYYIPWLNGNRVRATTVTSQHYGSGLMVTDSVINQSIECDYYDTTLNFNNIVILHLGQDDGLNFYEAHCDGGNTAIFKTYAGGRTELARDYTTYSSGHMKFEKVGSILTLTITSGAAVRTISAVDVESYANYGVGFRVRGNTSIDNISINADGLWMLQFELSTQDPMGSRGNSIWDVWCNGDYRGQAVTPANPRNDLSLSFNDGASGDDDRLWQLNQFLLPTFEKDIDNHIEMGFNPASSDYGYMRRLRVIGSSVNYGEYPKGHAYGHSDYVFSYWRWSLRDIYGAVGAGSGWFAGDGGSPLYQWNAETKDYDLSPVHEGVGTGRAHFYFTVPSGEIPKLRWLQRDDGKSMFLRGRRVDNEPSSRQSSLRQGWKNTYL